MHPLVDTTHNLVWENDWKKHCSQRTHHSMLHITAQHGKTFQKPGSEQKTTTWQKTFSEQSIVTSHNTTTKTWFWTEHNNNISKNCFWTEYNNNISKNCFWTEHNNIACTNLTNFCKLTFPYPDYYWVIRQLSNGYFASLAFST